MSEHSPLAGRVGIASLIVAEASLFGVFVVAYLFYVGKSVTFHIGHVEYALTLAKLEEAKPAPPWIACEFILEHE